MNKKQILGAILLLMASICSTALCNEPNQAQTQIKFETGERPTGKSLKDRIKRLPLKPKYLAEVFISNLPPELIFDIKDRQTTIPPRINIMWRNPIEVESVEITSRIDFTSQENIMKIINTPAGQNLSQQQKEFLTAGFGIIKIDVDVIPNYKVIDILGVTEEDARKTVEAFVYVLTQYANEKVELLKKEAVLQENEKLKIEEQIAEKETQYKQTQKQLSKIGKNIIYVSLDDAKQTVSELTRTINNLEIDIVGLQTRISANQIYVADKKDKLSPEALKSLQEMMGKDIIELASVTAKKAAAEKIMNGAQLFYELNYNLPIVQNNLNSKLSNIKSTLKAVKERIENPTSDFLPPKIFQNKGVIYPIDTGE